MSESKICGACGKPIEGASIHCCINCNKPVHSWALAEDLGCDVWMPEYGKYACSKACIEAFNMKQFEAHERLAAADDSDDEPMPPPEPVLLRPRPDAAIERASVLPGMRVTQHPVREGDGSRGFSAGIADSRGAQGPTPSSSSWGGWAGGGG